MFQIFLSLAAYHLTCAEACLLEQRLQRGRQAPIYISGIHARGTWPCTVAHGRPAVTGADHTAAAQARDKSQVMYGTRTFVITFLLGQIEHMRMR
jgi:hypothetical protein